MKRQDDISIINKQTTNISKPDSKEANDTVLFDFKVVIPKESAEFLDRYIKTDFDASVWEQKKLSSNLIFYLWANPDENNVSNAMADIHIFPCLKEQKSHANIIFYETDGVYKDDVFLSYKGDIHDVFVASLDELIDKLNSQIICPNFRFQVSIDNTLSRIGNWYEVRNCFCPETHIEIGTPVKVIGKEDGLDSQTGTVLWKVETLEQKNLLLSEAYLSPFSINYAVEKEYPFLSTQINDANNRRKEQSQNDNSYNKETVHNIR